METVTKETLIDTENLRARDLHGIEGTRDTEKSIARVDHLYH